MPANTEHVRPEFQAPTSVSLLLDFPNVQVKLPHASVPTDFDVGIAVPVREQRQQLSIQGEPQAFCSL